MTGVHIGIYSFNERYSSLRPADFMVYIMLSGVATILIVATTIVALIFHGVIPALITFVIEFFTMLLSVRILTTIVLELSLRNRL